MGVSYDLSGDCRNCVPLSLPWRESLGLRVADSHTGNHTEDDFTPLEIIRRPYSVIRKRIPFELEGETFEPERGFLEELESLGVRHVPAKLAEFLKEIQTKDRETVDKLQILEKEIELNAHQKDLFIQKLKGGLPY
ncbi:hypothetical protein Tco_0819736 [Tanacetum coccineum]|uniref:Uncharacterized protein n=1 Tax=Tanacetum coccineum TaxID=301880 RepID=A0ABQ5AAD7_9ASTR